MTSSCREKCRESRRACHSGLHCWVNWCVMTRTSSRAPIPSGSRYVVGNRYPSALGASAGTPTLTSKLESSAAARKESRGILSWARARSATSASRRPSRTMKRCSTPRPRSSAATTSDQDSSWCSRYTPLLSECVRPRTLAYNRNVPGWSITWLAARESMAASRVEPAGMVTVTRGPSEPPQAPNDIGGEDPYRGRRIAFAALLVEGQTDDDAGHVVLLEQHEKLAHREAFAEASGEGGEGLSQRAGLIGQGEADAALAPVDAEQPARVAAARHPCAMVAKNSLFVLVRLSRSSRNSIASTGGMSARKLRSRYTLLSSSLESRISSFRVPERWTSIAGNVRRSAIRRSRITSMFPVPLNSSKITSSIREPVSISAVARMVSEPPPSMLRAAPKNRFGFCRAFASTPPDRILPECGTTTL